MAKISATALAIKKVKPVVDWMVKISLPFSTITKTIQEGLFEDGLTGRDAVAFGTQYLSETLDIPLIIGPAGSDDSIAAYDVVKHRCRINLTFGNL